MHYTDDIHIRDFVASAASMELDAFEHLYKELSLLRVKRKGQNVIPKSESGLIEKINKGFPHDKWERLQFLDWKSEFGSLTDDENNELLELAEQFESYSVERIKNLAELAKTRQIDIDQLAIQFGIKTDA